MTDFYAISVDRATAEELNNVQEIVKANADGWWHRHASFWIVGGQSASKWRDLIKPVLTESPSTILVLRLPGKDVGRWWAFAGRDAEAKCKWLHDNFK